MLQGLQSSAITRPTQMSDKLSAEGRASMGVEETREFHEDMTEVCSDMMAKYSFSTISNQPKRWSIKFLSFSCACSFFPFILFWLKFNDAVKCIII